MTDIPRRARLPLLVGLVALSIPARAGAELAFFAAGNVMSIKGHRVEGDSVVILPRAGGEIVLPSAVIERFAPDEVPYPEPVEEQVRLKPDATDEGDGRFGSVRLQPDGSSGVRLQPDPGQPDRATYDPVINRVSAEQGVDANLVRAVIQVESAYQERARSPKGAMGLMQLMPETARHYAVADPYDPTANIEAGIKHLKSLLERFPLRLALAAYNAGEATVQRFRGVPPYPETRDFVARILQLVSR